jgi:hypothetical protein
MRKNYIIIVLFLNIIGVSRLVADVYWPWGGNSKKDLTSLPITSILSPANLQKEPVIINGYPLVLGSGFVENDLRECLRILKQNYPKAKYAKNGNSILVQVELDKNTIRRIFLIQLDGERFPVVQFSMDVPKKLPTEFDWPSELPLTSTMIPTQFMKFSKRGSMYGYFAAATTPERALSDIASELKARGWQSVTGETAGRYTKNGDVFLKNGGKEIIIVTLQEQEDFKVNGTIYLRKLN